MYSNNDRFTVLYLVANARRSTDSVKCEQIFVRGSLRAAAVSFHVSNSYYGSQLRVLSGQIDTESAIKQPITRIELPNTESTRHSSE